MVFRKFDFFIKEALLGLSRNRLMFFVTFGTLTVSLFLLGFFIILMMNVYSAIDSLQSKQFVMAYVKSGLEYAELEKLKAKIAGVAGVDDVKFVSRHSAWSSFKKKYGNELKLIGSQRINPLPDAFKIKIGNSEHVESASDYIEKINGIDELRYSKSLATKLATALEWLKNAGMFIIGLLGIATLFIMINTIHLTVIARKDELVIMKLVGATDNFIRAPFIIEGLLIGLSGSVASAILLKISYDLVYSRVINELFFVVLSSSGLMIMVYLIVMLSGTFIGMIGGVISVTSSLRKNAR